MPALDGTGPMGMGPMTGGGRGRCNPYYAGMRPPMLGFPLFQPLGWGGMPSGFGTYPLNPYPMGFRAFPCRPFRFGRGLRRRWW
jgi:hypothetical protein